MGVRRICCIGAGYTGCPTSAVIASKCRNILVTVVDEDAEAIMQWNLEKLPIYEPGLDELVKDHRNINLFFSTDIITSIKEADMIFVCGNTPIKSSGTGEGASVTDLKSVERAARLIADIGVGEKIIVDKTSKEAAELITKILRDNHHSNCQILFNPNIMVERNMIEELLHPDKVLIGGDDSPEKRAAIDKLFAVYERWVPREKIITKGMWSAELCRLAISGVLAQKLMSINSLCAICEATGVDITEIMEAIRMNDLTLGPEALEASLGIGGSHLKKDILSLINICEYFNIPGAASYWREVLDMNSYLTKRFTQKIIGVFFNTLTEKRIAIFGFTYKKDTSDTTESPAITICQSLIKEGARLHIYDPRADKNQILRDLNTQDDKGHQKTVTVFDDPYQCVTNTHAIVVCTKSEEFKTFDYERMFTDMLKPAYVFDGKQILPHRELMKLGFNVECNGIDLSKPIKEKGGK